jgi:hypothetical protein
MNRKHIKLLKVIDNFYRLIGVVRRGRTAAHADTRTPTLRHILGKSGFYPFSHVRKPDIRFRPRHRFRQGFESQAAPRSASSGHCQNEAAPMKSIKSEFALFIAGLMAVAPLVAICLGIALVLKG